MAALIALLLLAGCQLIQSPSTPSSSTTPLTASTLSIPPTITATVAPTASATPTATAVPLGPQQRIVLRDLPGVGRAPYSIALLGDKLYVADIETDNVAVIQDAKVIKYIPVGKGPGSITAD